MRDSVFVTIIHRFLEENWFRGFSAISTSRNLAFPLLVSSLGTGSEAANGVLEPGFLILDGFFLYFQGSYFYSSY